jgi:hypothetical protein
LPDPRQDVIQLQQRRDTERELHNRNFACRASDCAGRPPLLAHPELLRPRREYHLEWERALFDEQRVYAYLATVSLTRKVTSTGQIHFYGVLRSVGRGLAGQSVNVQCEARTRVRVVSQADGTELKRSPMEGMDVTSLTGIADTPSGATADPAHVAARGIGEGYDYLKTVQVRDYKHSHLE